MMGKNENVALHYESGGYFTCHELTIYMLCRRVENYFGFRGLYTASSIFGNETI